VNGFRNLSVTERPDADTDLGQIFAQPFHANGKAFAIGHFAFDNTGEGIIFFGFCRKSQIFNGFNRCLPGFVYRGFIVSFEVPFPLLRKNTRRCPPPPRRLQ
jgi:hypothetical protein